MAAPTDPKIKAQALADLATGAELKATARKFHVSPHSLRKWRAEAGLTPVHTAPVRAQIWELVDLYLLEAIQTLRVQLEFSRDAAYVKSHDTSGLAALHNSIAEKVARMVEAEEASAVEPAAPVDIRSRAR